MDAAARSLRAAGTRTGQHQPTYRAPGTADCQSAGSLNKRVVSHGICFDDLADPYMTQAGEGGDLPQTSARCVSLLDDRVPFLPPPLVCKRSATQPLRERVFNRHSADRIPRRTCSWSPGNAAYCLTWTTAATDADGATGRQSPLGPGWALPRLDQSPRAKSRHARTCGMDMVFVAKLGVHTMRHGVSQYLSASASQLVGPPALAPEAGRPQRLDHRLMTEMTP